MPRRILFISSLALGLMASGQIPGDPVMRVRAQRAAAQGISEGDLPALPKGIMEPPPLPLPELHVKDTRRGRRGHRKPGKTVRTKGRKPAISKASTTRKHR